MAAKRFFGLFTAKAAADLSAIGDPTYAAPSAMPAAISGGEAPTEAEFLALRTAVDSIRTQLIALAADVATHKTLLNELRTQNISAG